MTRGGVDVIGTARTVSGFSFGVLSLSTEIRSHPSHGPQRRKTNPSTSYRDLSILTMRSLLRTSSVDIIIIRSRYAVDADLIAQQLEAQRESPRSSARSGRRKMWTCALKLMGGSARRSFWPRRPRRGSSRSTNCGGRSANSMPIEDREGTAE